MALDSESASAAEVAAAERTIGRAYLDAVAWLRSQATIASIAQAIREYRLGEVLAEADISVTAESIATATNDAYVRAARKVAAHLTRKLAKPTSYDAVNTRAVRAIQSNTLEKVREVSDEIRTVVRRAVSDGITAGMNPRAQARMIRGSIGLTEKQYEIVANYRAKLVAGDPRALSYKLRDRRFDRTVRAKKPLTEKQIETMVQRYQDRLVRYRATVIARTEALRSVHLGAEEMWAQAIDSGSVDPDAIVRTWRHAGGGRHSRDGHKRMHGQKRAIGVAFVNAVTGMHLRFPCDPNAPVSETAQCRCLVTVRLAPAPA